MPHPATLDALIATFGSRVIVRGVGAVAQWRADADAGDDGTCDGALSLGWPEFDALLPDGGFPKGVVELASPRALGGSTAVALMAVRSAQKRDGRSWCAWLDAEGSLYAPGVAAAGVDLARLLVVRPPRDQIDRIAVKVASSRAFDVIVFDLDAVLGSTGATSLGKGTRGASPRKKAWPADVLVRKLSLLAEEGGATIVLLTDALASRSLPLPVALRLELSRPTAESLAFRVAKDRRGRIGLAKTLPLPGTSLPLASPSPFAGRDRLGSAPKRLIQAG